LGGDLYNTYLKQKLHGSEPHAQFYIGSIILALEYLHSQSVVYRDLKGENLQLDHAGNLKFADFGTAKFIEKRTWTVLGTPAYFAPEMVQGLVKHTSTGFAVDWWAVGINLFSFLAGYEAFDAAMVMQIYKKINEGIDKVKFPSAASRAKPLIKALLKKNPDKRLPMLPDGMAILKGNDWFAPSIGCCGGRKPFDWQALENQTLPPPYVPKVKTIEELAAIKLEVPPREPYEDDGTGWADVF